MRDGTDSRPVAFTLALLLVALLALPVAARETPASRQKKLGPESPQVRLVLEALKTSAKGDDRALQELINAPRALDANDPWVIAHEMILRKEWRAAETFAAAGNWGGVRHLAAYVRAFGRRSPSVDQWAVLRRVLRHSERKEWGSIIELVGRLDDEDFDRPDVVTVRLRLLEIQAYRALDQEEEVLARACSAAQEARALGWLVAARDLHFLWRRAAGVLQVHEAMQHACGGLGLVFEAMGNSRRAATYLTDQATVQAQLGLMDGAIQGFGVVLADYDPVLTAGQRIHLLNSMAMGREVLGHYAPGLRDAGRARVLVEIALPQARVALQAARKTLATAEKMAAESAEGGALIEGRVRAVRVARRTEHQKQHLVWLLEEERSWAYQILGTILLNIRDYDEAERMFNRSVGLLEELERSGPEAERAEAYMVETRANLDMLEFQRVREGGGDLDVVEAGLKTRLAYFRKRRGENARYIEVANCGLAEVMLHRALRSDSPPERAALLAEARLELQAVEKRQKALGDRLSRCITLRELAAVHRAEGSSEKALYELRRASTLAYKMSAEEQYTQCLAALAEVELELETPRPERALEHAHKGLLSISALFDTLPPGLASLARGRTARIYTVGLRAAVMLNDAEEAFFFLDGQRAGALRTGMERIAAVRAAKVDRRLLRDEARARVREAQAYGALLKSYESPRLKDAQAAHRKFNAARLEHRVALQLVQLDARLKAQLRLPEVVLPKEVQMALAEDEALVLQGLAGDEAVAVVLTQKKLRLVSLGGATAIRQACSALSLDDDSKAGAKSLAKLRSLIVEPLGLDHAVKRVLFSCTGCLAYQPPSLLFPFREVACVSSASAYVTTLSARPVMYGQVLAIGDPSYGAIPEGWGANSRQRDSKRRDLGRSPRFPGRSRRGFQPLPNSGPEIESVGDMILRGKDATETHVVQVLGQTESLRAVHFAVHAQADEESPHFSALALTPSAEDDGLLTALEIYQLRINADLVVLSACESGRGLNAGGEGIVGLTNAFLFAGARQVLVSLWQVDDEASRVLMVEFHRLWNHKDPRQRLGAGAALRAAQEYVRTYAETHKDKRGKPLHPHWEKPYYWAAWQLWGAGD